MLSRRQFFQRTAVAGAVLGLPWAQAQAVAGEEAPSLPSPDLFTKDSDRYWAELRRQWLLAPDRINLNCGSVGCSPLPVLKAMIDHLLASEAFRDIEDYPWFGNEEKPFVRDLRDDLAAFLHCKRDELALTRNATDGNNIVCNGLDFKPGDEVLLTDQEHPGGRCCWEQKAERFGGPKINVVSIPKPPTTVEDLVGRFEKALTPNTKMIFFSHVTTVTGVVLPAKEICQMARKRGILTHVDGAHTIGQIPLDMHDMGCDFYATSPHKWLLAPKGTGTLFIREELLDRLWVTIATAEWKNRDLKAYRFSRFGTSNLSIIAGLKGALDFFKTIGPERIYQRIHALATKVRDRVQDYKQVKLANASADAFFGGLVSFEPVKGDLKRVIAECKARHIRVAGNEERIRVATHIFNQPTELNAFFDALDKGLR